MNSEILTPGAHLYQREYAAEYREGEVVVIHAQGKFRTAEVVKEGPKRVTTTRTNPSTGRTFEKAEPREGVYLLSGDEREFAGVVRERGGRGPRGQHLEV